MPEKSRQGGLYDVGKDDTVVLLLGQVGCGKSTFINCAAGELIMTVGHNLTSETKSVSYCILRDPRRSSGRFIFVDTPGFDDYNTDDREVLDHIVRWLKDSGRISLKLHVIYLVEISQARQPEERMCPSLLMNGIFPSLIVATTKWSDTPTESETVREQEYSAIYSPLPCRFRNSRESAWDVVHFRSNESPVVQLLMFGTLLDSVLPRTMPKPRYGIRAVFAGLFGFMQKKPPSVKRTQDPQDRTRVVSELSERLALVFRDPLKCRLILSCHGIEAQALLDTFQLILDLGCSDNDLRRNLIIAIRRLSTKTDLYPAPFFLKKLDQVNERPVAGGAYGDIHRGVYQGRHVCLKLIKVYATTRPERIVKLIAREASLWGQLTHPNLLPFYGLYLYMDRTSLISPWASNGTISDFLVRHPSANRLLLCSDIVEGVGYLHDNDIVHGDLKGVNILIDKSRRAYLADFGLSAVDDPEIMAWSRNSTASRGGTVRWQAPELFKIETSEDTETPRNTKSTDVYAFSCVCYEIFSGSIPFPMALDGQVMLKVMSGERPVLPADLDRNALGLTEELWELIQRCWHGDATKRLSISEVRSQLAPLLPTDSRRPGEWQDRLSVREGELTADIPLTPRMLDKILRRTLG